MATAQLLDLWLSRLIQSFVARLWCRNKMLVSFLKQGFYVLFQFHFMTNFGIELLEAWLERCTLKVFTYCLLDKLAKIDIPHEIHEFLQQLLQEEINKIVLMIVFLTVLLIFLRKSTQKQTWEIWEGICSSIILRVIICKF